MGGERTDTEGGCRVSHGETQPRSSLRGSFYWSDKYLLTVCPVPRHQERGAKTDPFPVLKTLTYVGTQALIKHKHGCVNCAKCREGKGHCVPSA